MYLLAYNLIRQVMAEAAMKSGVSPHEIRFKGNLQTHNQFLPLLAEAVSLGHWYDSLLTAIATHKGPTTFHDDTPGRCLRRDD